jgi:hypothetical protein
MSQTDRNSQESTSGAKRVVSSELRALLDKVSAELEHQTKQFAFVTRLDFWIQFSIISAVFVIIMTLLGSTWSGLFLVAIISGVLTGLRWLQAQTITAAIDKIRDILK